MAATKKVVNREVITSSRPELIQNTVNTNPEIIVAMRPELEYLCQKNVIKIADDNVPPTPAQAQTTTRYNKESEIKAITIPSNPTIKIVSLDIITNCLSVKLIPNVLWMISSLTELVTTMS